MLDREALDALNDKGVDAFIEDFKMASPLLLAESSPVDLKEWHNQMVSDLRSFKKEVDKAINPIAHADESAEEEEGEEFEDEVAFEQHVAKAHLDGYLEGFKDGVKEGMKIAQELRRK
jgi:flagellar biosynthesis/type III secretory pathway protein FliH